MQGRSCCDELFKVSQFRTNPMILMVVTSGVFWRTRQFKGLEMTISKQTKWALGAVLLALVGFAFWRLGPALLEPEHLDVGIMVGEKAPVEMTVQNASGEPIAIADVAGPDGLVLVMTRSADWCPFCIMQIKDHADAVDALTERGYRIASLSYDSPDILAEFTGSNDIPYPMLSDAESAFIDAVALRDPEYPEGHYAYGVPRASILVLAPDGTVQAKLVSADYRQRPDNDQLIDLVDSASN